jgi:ABC-type multidrug transport system fused ATPase/permease subunit
MKIFSEAKLIWRYLKPYKKRVYLISGIAVSGSAISAVVPYIYGRLTDLVINRNNFYLIAGILVFWLILNFAEDWATRNTKSKGRILSQEVGNNLLLEISGHLFNLPLQFHKNEKLGKVISKVERADNRLTMIINQVVFSILPQFLTLILAIIIMATVEWRLTACLFFILIFYAFITFYKTIPIIQSQKKINKAWEMSYGNFHDSVLNVETVKNFTRECFERKKLYNDFQIKALGIFKSHIHLWHSLNFWQQTIFSVGFVLIFGISLFFLNQGVFTVGELLMFVGYIGLVYGPFDRLAVFYRDFREGIAVIESATKLLEEKPEEYFKNGTKILKGIEGKVEFKNVTFGYKKTVPILENINFEVRPGEIAALVGESGVGKSTLVALISRYYLPQKGKILIDDTDVSSIDLRSLRKQIAIVPQEVMLFNDSIKNNIKYGRINASDEEIITAAKIANAHDFIESFPYKYRQIVGERGIKLSTGQKQRVAIARAVLRNPKILILDEATSSLDAKSERLVHEALEKLIRNRTTFIIAHRLSTTRKADKIIVLENGKIAEIGNHEELMKKEGVYFKLYSLQIDLK